MTKIAGCRSGSGSISQRHGSANPVPDPHQNVMDPQHCCQVLLPIILLMAWTTEQERTISWQVGLYLTILIVNLSNTTMIVLAVRNLNQESQGINGGERYHQYS
jgi:hypothetical protein